MAGIKIQKPDGTVVEIDKATLSSLQPDQLSAIMSSLAGTNDPGVTPTPVEEPALTLSIDEVVAGSKRDKVALFLANQYSIGMSLETKEIHRDWMEMVARDNYDLYLEKSHLNQYLTRLAEYGYIGKNKIAGRGVRWTIEEHLVATYPEIPIAQFNEILSNSI